MTSDPTFRPLQHADDDTREALYEFLAALLLAEIEREQEQTESTEE